MTKTRAFEVVLTIPDNEAYTALVALQRLGIACAGVKRADVWTFDVEERAADDLEASVRDIETIFNPNKHRLVPLENAKPQSGEVWIGEEALARPGGPVTIAGRTLGGVAAVHRYTAWRLEDSEGRPVAAAELNRAVATLLCNPAFQRTIS